MPKREPLEDYYEEDSDYETAKPLRQKEKRRLKKNKKRRSEDLEENGSSSSDSEMDLEKELKPIRFYMKDRSEMVRQMFRALKGKQLKKIMPDILKKVPLSELEKLCTDEVAVMSKKRIRYILAGREMTSSSGTEETESEPEQDGVLEALRRRYFAQNEQSQKPEKSEVQQEQPDSTVADDFTENKAEEQSANAPPNEEENESEKELDDVEIAVGEFEDNLLEVEGILADDEKSRDSDLVQLEEETMSDSARSSGRESPSSDENATNSEELDFDEDSGGETPVQDEEPEKAEIIPEGEIVPVETSAPDEERSGEDRREGTPIQDEEDEKFLSEENETQPEYERILKQETLPRNDERRLNLLEEENEQIGIEEECLLDFEEEDSRREGRSPMQDEEEMKFVEEEDPNTPILDEQESDYEEEVEKEGTPVQDEEENIPGSDEKELQWLEYLEESESRETDKTGIEVEEMESVVLEDDREEAGKEVELGEDTDQDQMLLVQEECLEEQEIHEYEAQWEVTDKTESAELPEERPESRRSELSLNSEEKINKIQTEGRTYRKKSLTPDVEEGELSDGEIGEYSNQKMYQEGTSDEKQLMRDFDEDYDGDNLDLDSEILLSVQKESREEWSPESISDSDAQWRKRTERIPTGNVPSEPEEEFQEEKMAEDAELTEVWPPPSPEILVPEETEVLETALPPPPVPPTTVKVDIGSPSGSEDYKSPVASSEPTVDVGASAEQVSEDEESRIAEAAEADLKHLMEAMFAMANVKGERPPETLLKENLEGRGWESSSRSVTDSEEEEEDVLEGPSWKPEGWPTPPKEDEMEEGEVREGYRSESRKGLGQEEIKMHAEEIVEEEMQEIAEDIPDEDEPEKGEQGVESRSSSPEQEDLGLDVEDWFGGDLEEESRNKKEPAKSSSEDLLPPGMEEQPMERSGKRAHPPRRDFGPALALLAPRRDPEEGELEGYDSDYETGGQGSEVLPPGFEPGLKNQQIEKLKAAAAAKRRAEKQQEMSSSDSGTKNVRTSIVPIKTLYKQLKEAKEAKKKPEKLYAAKFREETAAIPEEEKKKKKEKTEKPAGPSLPPPEEWKKEEPREEKKKKKPSQVLTPEFLAELEKKKEEHAKEMKEKTELYEKLKARREAAAARKKEIREKLEKMKELKLPVATKERKKGPVDISSSEGEMEQIAQEEQVTKSKRRKHRHSSPGKKKARKSREATPPTPPAIFVDETRRKRRSYEDYYQRSQQDVVAPPGDFGKSEEKYRRHDPCTTLFPRGAPAVHPGYRGAGHRGYRGHFGPRGGRPVGNYQPYHLERYGRQRQRDWSAWDDDRYQVDPGGTEMEMISQAGTEMRMDEEYRPPPRPPRETRLTEDDYAQCYVDTKKTKETSGRVVMDPKKKKPKKKVEEGKQVGESSSQQRTVIAPGKVQQKSRGRIVAKPSSEQKGKSGKKGEELELIELEMRARAIRALMKRSKDSD